MDQNDSLDHRMTSEIGKQVFTTNGIYVGTVCDIMLDVNDEKATRLAVNELNNDLFEGIRNQRGVLIPYRWVRATNDVVLVADIVERLEPVQHETTSVTDMTSATESVDESDSEPAQATARQN